MVLQGALMPTLKVAYGMLGHGGFRRLLRFDKGPEQASLPLSTVVKACLDAVRSDATGLVMLAETASLIGASLPAESGPLLGGRQGARHLCLSGNSRLAQLYRRSGVRELHLPHCRLRGGPIARGRPPPAQAPGPSRRTLRPFSRRGLSLSSAAQRQGRPCRNHPPFVRDRTNPRPAPPAQRLARPKRGGRKPLPARRLLVRALDVLKPPSNMMFLP